jgi:pimeloyl-ACP methyl ester carboxylesterase
MSLLVRLSLVGRVSLALPVALALLLALSAANARSDEPGCEPDGVQSSGSIYRICIPATGYNGMLVVWAHGFQDAGTPVSIPEDQLCQNNFCLPDLVNSLGFAFATNSYSKTGLAVIQGQSDLLDLVKIFTAEHGKPTKVFLVGASEGGLITALSVEQHPDVFSAGVAACGPIGDFASELNYFGDARVTFNYFFPGVIPGDPFDPPASVSSNFESYYDTNIKPVVFDPANRHKLDQWAAVAHLPSDASNYLDTVAVSVHDVLRYSVVNIKDAAQTLGGFPFDNSLRWYSGSDNDLLLNLFVRRAAASPAAVAEMKAHYDTTGVLSRPLITMHTLRDQQVPYFHENLYALKTLFSGSFLTRQLNVPIDRFGHCNFTKDEALFSFAVMLLYDGILNGVSGTSSFLSPAEQTAFDRDARSVNMPVQPAGSQLAFKLAQG